MATVRVLEDSVANKIAAGEVVERPASAVKELVENSLDAGARRVEVELMGAGRDLIRVVDDGAGMAPEDAALAVLPHATSKITTVDDLASIGTFGFRGEALPSIAAVSHFILMTRRPEDDAGVMVRCESGGAPEVSAIGCPPGTSVAAHHLFHNTPARLKFLKENRTELGRSIDLVGRLALAFPEVAFRVTNEGKEVFQASPVGDLRARIAQVIGREALKNLLPFDVTTPLLRVHGYCSDLALHRPNRTGQYILVNRRTIRSPILARALSNAYEGLLPYGRNPVIVLFLEMDPRLVDPNVHPTKQEVRFPREGEVFRTVHGAIRSALLAADLVPDAPPISEAGPLGPIGVASPSRPSVTPDLPLSHAAPTASLDAFRQALQARVAEDDGLEDCVEGAAHAPEPGQDAVDVQSGDWSTLRVIGQAMDSFVLAELNGELLLIDQHAAHERVLFERFMEATGDRPFPSQGLLAPDTVELAPAEMAVLHESLDVLESLGLRVEPFGNATALVRGVPALRRSMNGTRLLQRILADLLDDESEFRAVKDIRTRLCATAACKAAVKQGDPLTPEEMRALLADLSQLEMRFTCPHARPAVVRLGREALDRYFHRR